MKVAVLIDFDNLSEPQKVSILDVATKALMQLPKAITATRGECILRIYGGWYEEMTMTNRAQTLSVSIQAAFPENIRIPMLEGKFLTLTTSAELAMALVEDPSHHLFYTHRRKGKPANIRVMKPEEAGCTSSLLNLSPKHVHQNKGNTLME